MANLKQPTTLERIAGHTATEAALTAIGALVGDPTAAILPVLSNSLASGRHRQRVEEALADIDANLQKHAAAIRMLTDEQYKLINELVIALLHTTAPAKLAYLKHAIENTVVSQDLAPQETVVLGRVIRDISAEEAEFLVRNFRYDRVQLASLTTDEPRRATLRVDPKSRDGMCVVGLLSLGLLISGEDTYDDSSLLMFSPIVVKLLVLLRQNDH